MTSKKTAVVLLLLLVTSFAISGFAAPKQAKAAILSHALIVADINLKNVTLQTWRVNISASYTGGGHINGGWIDLPPLYDPGFAIWFNLDAILNALCKVDGCGGSFGPILSQQEQPYLGVMRFDFGNDMAVVVDFHYDPRPAPDFWDIFVYGIPPIDFLKAGNLKNFGVQEFNDDAGMIGIQGGGTWVVNGVDHNFTVKGQIDLYNYGLSLTQRIQLNATFGYNTAAKTFTSNVTSKTVTQSTPVIPLAVTVSLPLLLAFIASILIATSVLNPRINKRR